MPVQKQHEKKGELTILEVTGRITAEELIDAIKEFYRDGCTAKLIWDIRATDLTTLSTEQLRQVLSIAQSYGHLRPNGKTAIVVTGDLAFGLGRMYEILCEIDQHPIPLKVVKSMDEARAWLDE